jgi:hypothetical protein
VWDDAAPEFRAAVERLDESIGSAATPAAELATVLATERTEDSLSLYHLLDSALDDAPRAQVYERLVALAPQPEGVTRAGCLAREPAQLLAWRDAMGWAWPAGTSSKLKGEPLDPGAPR